MPRHRRGEGEDVRRGEGSDEEIDEAGLRFVEDEPWARDRRHLQGCGEGEDQGMRQPPQEARGDEEDRQEIDEPERAGRIPQDRGEIIERRSTSPDASPGAPLFIAHWISAQRT